MHYPRDNISSTSHDLQSASKLPWLLSRGALLSIMARHTEHGTPSGSTPSHPSSSSNYELNKALVSAQSADDVFGVVRAHVHRFNDVNCATALSRLSRWQGADEQPRELGALLRQTAATLSCNGSRAAHSCRTLTAMAAALPRLGLSCSAAAGSEGWLVLIALCNAVAGILPGAEGAPGALATILWTLGTLHIIPEDALMQRICAAAAREAAAMSAAELANACWGAARARIRSPRLMEALGQAACKPALLQALTPQGLSNTAWAWAKLRSPNSQLFSALAAAATAHMRSGRRPGFGGQDLATLAWAFSRTPDAALNASICAAVKPLLGGLSQQATTALLQALTSGADKAGGGSADAAAAGVDPDVLDALGGHALCRVASSSAQELGLLAAAVVRGSARVPCNDAARVADALAARCSQVHQELDWRGVAALDIALRLLLHGAGTCSAGAAKKRKRGTLPEIDATASAPSSATRYVSDTLRLDPAVELSGEAEISPATSGAMARLASRALLVAADEMATACDAANRRPQSLLLSLLPAAFGSAVVASKATGGPSAAAPSALCALLVGDDPDGAVTDALMSRGFVSVTHWRRFASEGGAVGAPPAQADAPSECLPGMPMGGEAAANAGGHYDAAVVRFPQSADACAFLLHAIAPALRNGAHLWLFGSAEEGIAESSLSSCRRTAGFGEVATLTTSAEGCVVICARKLRDIDISTSQALCQPRHETLRLPAHPQSQQQQGDAKELPWVVYPGLFAAGVLDVMTAALLRALPLHPPPGAKVLDFACGSGVIAAALLERESTLRLTLLDADAVALRAAAANVPAAKRVILSAGWPSPTSKRLRPGRRVLSWIVSNPPVHRGQPDDLRVLLELLRGAPARLKPGGTLWVVAQCQVPVGRLAAGVKGTSPELPAYSAVTATPAEGGRFFVWRATVS